MKQSFYMLFMRAVLLLMVPLAGSCRKELCYNHFRAVSIGLEWEQEWERDYGMNHSSNWNAVYHGLGYDELRPERPEWVNLIQYTATGLQTETYLYPEGGDVKIDNDESQSFLLYNGDTEYIILSDMVSAPQARASATGRSRSSLQEVKDKYPGSRTTNPPDVIYSAYVNKVPSVGLHEILPVPIKMQPLVYTYVINYEFEYGLHNVALARGALGGMAESVYLMNGKTSEETAIILYDCSLTDTGCRAYVKTFGVPGFTDEYFGQLSSKSREQMFTLNLEVRLTHGRYYEFTYDITDQILNQPRGGVIKVSGIRIEDDWNPCEGSAFDVGVDDWGDREDIDLPVEPTD